MCRKFGKWSARIEISLGTIFADQSETTSEPEAQFFSVERSQREAPLLQCNLGWEKGPLVKRNLRQLVIACGCCLNLNWCNYFKSIALRSGPQFFKLKLLSW